jgi:hypothetical protein
LVRVNEVELKILCEENIFVLPELSDMDPGRAWL